MKAFSVIFLWAQCFVLGLAVAEGVHHIFFTMQIISLLISVPLTMLLFHEVPS